MMTSLKRLIIALSLLITISLTLAVPAYAVNPIDPGGGGATPSPTPAPAPTTTNCRTSFFGLKTWSYYLQKNADCSIADFKALPESGNSDFILIILAIIDDLLIVAGFVAVGFIIAGGIIYITSQGAPDQTQKGQQAIQNALIGLLVAILAIATVRYIGGRLT